LWSAPPPPPVADADFIAYYLVDGKRTKFLSPIVIF